MKTSRIDWKKVQHLMIDEGIRSKKELAQRAGIHFNTIYSDGPFLSTTLDKLANLFDCPHEDLVMYVEEK